MQGRPSAARQRTAACPCWSPAGVNSRFIKSKSIDSPSILKKSGNVHSFRKPYFSYSLMARALSLHTSRFNCSKPFSLTKARTASVSADAAASSARARSMTNKVSFLIFAFFLHSVNNLLLTNEQILLHLFFHHQLYLLFLYQPSVSSFLEKNNSLTFDFVRLSHNFFIEL